MNVSFDILTTSHSYYQINGGSKHTTYLFVNGSLQPFSRQHLPYAIIACFMLSIYNILPLLLLSIYPCSCFQKLLNLGRCRCQVLHIFMDTVLGCYRVHPWDCRYMAAFYLALRNLNLLGFSLTKNPLYYLGGIYMFLVAVIVLDVCKPYKSAWRNSCDIFLFAVGAAVYTAIILSFSV